MRYLSISALGWVISCLMFTAFGQSSISLESCTVTATSSDTIYVNEEFLGVTYTKVGPHENIIQHLTSVEGCDSIVTHRLIVKPDPTVKEYYVRVDGEGNGSGWDKSLAMNGEDFATYLPLVPDGTTFHVAEGTYHPGSYPSLLEDCWPDKEPSVTDILYTYHVKGQNISILGGYPKDPKKDEKRMPEIYKATFSGDLNDDTEWIDRGYDKMPINIEDETFCIMYVDNAEVLLSGISFENSAFSLIYENSDLTVNNCLFTHNSDQLSHFSAGCIRSSGKCNLNIENRYNKYSRY